MLDSNTPPPPPYVFKLFSNSYGWNESTNLI